MFAAVACLALLIGPIAAFADHTVDIAPVAGNGVVDASEWSNGFVITGVTGSNSNVSVTVTLGTDTWQATSDFKSSDQWWWEVDVPGNRTYLTEGNHTVSAEATINGVTDSDSRDFEVDLTLPLSVDDVTGDNEIDSSEHANGFAITGYTSLISGVTVVVTINSTQVGSGTSDSNGDWSVSVPDYAGYISGTSVPLSVTATKDGYGAATVSRTLDLDVSYTLTVAEDIETAADLIVVANNDWSLESVTDPSNGTAAVKDGSTTEVTYKPNDDYFGSDSFTYTISKGSDESTGTVNVTVTAVNDAPAWSFVPPVVTELSTTVDENTASGTPLFNNAKFLAGDVDQKANDPLVYTLEGADKDSFSIDSDDPVLKTKDDLDYETQVQYEIEVVATDNGGGEIPENLLSVKMPVTITVNDLPGGVVDDTLTVAEDTAGDLDVIDNDTGTLTLTAVGNPSNGTAAVKDGSTTEVTYTPNDDYFGSDSFTYTATDGTDTSQGTVNVTVTAVNDAPVVTGDAQIDYAENGSGSVFTFSAADPEGDSVTWGLAGDDSGDFSIDSATGVLSFNASPDFEAPADEDRDNEYQVTVQAADGSETGELAVTVAVTEVNEAPVVTGDARIDYAENGSGSVFAFSAADPEGDPVTWGLAGDDSGDFSIDSATGVLSFNASPDFEAPADEDGDNEYQVTVQAADGSETGELAVTVAVTEVNEAPVVTGDARIDYAENGSGSVFAFSAADPEGDPVTWGLAGDDSGDFSIDGATGVLSFNASPDFEAPADEDGDNEYQVTVQAADGSETGELAVTVAVTDQPAGVVDDTLTVAEDTAGDLDVIDNDTGTLTLTAVGNPSNGTAAVKDGSTTEVTYTPNDDYFGSDSFTYTATDGTDTSQGTVNVTVTAVNDAPVVTGDARIDYAENGSGSVFTFSAADPEGDPVTWGLAGDDSGDFSIDSATGVLSFNASPDFEAPADEDRDNEYQVTVQAADGSETGELAVTVAVTDQPGGVVDDTLTVAEDTAGDLDVIDNDTGTLTLTAVGNPSNGTAAVKDGSTTEVTYTPNDDYFGSDSFTYTATDGTDTSQGTVNVTVTAVNDAPVVTGDARIDYAENGSGSVFAFSAADPEGDPVTWGLAGDDSGDFSIDGATGVLSFNASPDFEAPADEDGDNEYQVTVQAADGSETGELAVTVAVTEVNEAPVVTGDARIDYAENRSGSVFTFSAADPEGDPVTWGLAGDDSGDFSIDGATGVLSFNASPDFEAPADEDRDNEYQVTVQAADGSETGELAVTVAVTEANEAPVVTGDARIDYAENGSGSVFTFSAADPEGDPVTWGLAGDDSGDFSIDSATGVLSFNASPDFEAPADEDGDNEYQVTVQAADGSETGELAVTVAVTEVNEAPVVTGDARIDYAENGSGSVFTFSAADPEGDPVTWGLAGDDSGDFSIDSATGVLSFNASPDFEAPADEDGDNEYQVTVQAADGSETGELAVTVAVTEVNEAPVVTGDARIDYAENGSGSVFTFSAADPEGDPVTWGLAGDDSGDFSIDGATGVLSFNASPDFEAPADEDGDNEYQVTVQAADGSETGELAVTVAVTEVNEAPTFDDGSSITRTVAENATGDVGDPVKATDPEKDTLTYSLGGTNVNSFTIDSTNGQLTLGSNVTPDYDTQASYSLTVSVSDGLDASGSADNTVDATIDVTVNVLPPPPPAVPAPAAPTGFDATGGDGQVTLKWDNPNNAGIQRWEYQHKEGTGEYGSWRAIRGSTAATTEHTVANLANGTEHTFRLRAVNATGNGDASEPRSTTPVAAAADAQPSLAAIDNQVYTRGEAIDVLMLPASSSGNGALAYALSPAPPAGLAFDADARTLSGTPTADQAATDYTYVVRDADGDQASRGFSIAVTPPPAPAAPTGFDATGGDGQATLKWDNPNNAGIQRWEYQHKEGTGEYGSWRAIRGSTAATTEHTVANLANATEHTFRLRAVNATGNGDASEPRSTTPVAAAADAQPSLAAIDNQVYTRGEAIDVLMLPASSSGNGTLAYALSPAPPAGLAFDADARTLSGTPTADQAATDYTYVVRDADGDQASRGFSIAVTPPPAPAAPTGFDATGGDGQATLKWDNPNDASIQRWEYQHKEGTGEYGSWRAIGGSTATTTEHTVANLANGTEHTFRLRAVNAIGNGKASEEKTATPAADNNPPTVAVPFTHRTLTVGAILEVDVSATFDDLDGDTLTYTAASDNLAALTVTLSEAKLRLTGEAPGTAAVTVTASDGEASASDTFTVEIKADALPSFSSRVPDQTYTRGVATTTLTLPPASGGNGMLRYSLSPAPPPGLVFDPDARTLSGTPTAAQDATAYTYTAVDADGDVASRGFAIAVTAAPPAAPVNFAATAGDARVTLTWDTAGDASILHWEYQSKEGAGGYGAWTAIAGSGPDTTAQALEPLVNGTAYTFRVRAVNEAGDGAASPERSATPRGGNNPPTVVAPIADRKLIVGASELVRISDAFDDHDGDALTYTVASEDPDALKVTLSSMTLRLTGQAPGKAAVTVTASDGEESASDTFTVEREADAQPSFASDIPDQTYTLGVAITTLTLPLSSGGNTALRYSLSPRPPPGLVFDPVARTLSGTPTAVQATTAYTYTAVDSNDDVASSGFSIAVTAPPPAAPANFAATAGDARVTLTWDTASDTSILRWEYRQKEGTGGYGAWKAIAGSGSNNRAHTVEPLVNGTEYTFRVRAANKTGDGAASPERSATPRAGNNPPTVAAPIADRALTVGATLDVDVSATFNDDDGDALTYTAASDNPAAVTVTLSEATLRLTGEAPGTAAVTVTASDGEESASNTFAVEVNAEAKPNFTSGIPDQTYTQGMAIATLTLPLARGGNDPLRYSLIPAPPPGLVFDPDARALSGTPKATQAATAYTYTAVDADGDVASRGFAIAVTAAPPAAPGNFAATAGDARVTLTWDTADDGSILRWEYRRKEGAGGYGAWTAIAGSGPDTTAHAVEPLVNGTAHTFRLRAVNGVGDGAASPERSATPRAGNNPPTVAVPIADRTVTVGAILEVDVSAVFNDHDGDALTYTAASDNPAAMPVTLSEATLRLTGEAPGKAAVTVTASDGKDSASNTFTVAVEANAQPNFTSDIPDQTYTQGAAITTLTLPLADGGNGALRYSLSPAPPPGLAFDPDARTLSGTPAAIRAATAYTYTAVDADGDVASRGFAIRVIAEKIPPTVASFQKSTYTATESGMAATMVVSLSRARNEELAIPIRVTRSETTEVDDYTVEGLKDWDAQAGAGTLVFPAGASERTWRIAANDDGDGDDETLELRLGELPDTVVAGEQAVATVTLKDKGLVALKVSFGQAKYRVPEGQQADIEIRMSPAADRRVEVPLVIAPSGGATEEDYGEVPASVVFEEGESQRTISVAATMDEVNDPNEGIVLSPGGLPERVSAVDPASTQVHFLQRRSVDQFSQTQEATLAVVARSMAQSAETAIQRRFERHRQWSHRGASGGVKSTTSPAHYAGNTTPNPGESERTSSGYEGGMGAEGPAAHNVWAATKVSATTASGWNSSNPQTGGGRSWLRSFSLGSVGNIMRSGPPAHLDAYPGSVMETHGRVHGQDRLYDPRVGGPPLGTDSDDFPAATDLRFRLSEVSFEMSPVQSEKETSWVPVLWGQGDLQRFNGDLTRLGMDYRGGLDAAHVGLDLYAKDRLLAGLSFMRSWGDLDYTDDEVDGVLKSRMNTVHPYLYWQPNKRVSVWGIGGLGGGQLDVREPGRTHDFDADFRMLAGGVRAVLGQRDNNEWSLRADGFTTQLETGASEDIDQVSGEAHRGRLMLEWVHARELSAGGSLSLQAEVGGRFDGGDAERGAGVETGVRLGYLDANHGLDVALHGRALVVHESDYRDWGVGVQASWDPGEKQRGFRASAMSSWGQDGEGRTTLWDNSDAVTRPVGTGALAPANAFRMESEVAYGGIKAPGLPGLLTPYSRLRWAGSGREMTVGASWNLAEGGRSPVPFTIELEALRREDVTDAFHHELLLRISTPLGNSRKFAPSAARPMVAAPPSTNPAAAFVQQATPDRAAESDADNAGAAAASRELPAAPASARKPGAKPTPEPVANAPALPASRPSRASNGPQSMEANIRLPRPAASLRGSLVVQLGAFRSAEKSARLADRLRHEGFAALRVHGNNYERVVVGPFPNRIDAIAAQSKLDAQGYRGYVRQYPGLDYS